MSEVLDRRTVLRAAATGAGIVAAAMLAACASPATRPDRASPPPPSPTATAGADPAPDATEGADTVPAATGVLIAYFSRAGENYYYGDRTTLEIGNTEVLVGMMTDRIQADVYRIESAEPYSDSYDDTVARNSQEQDAYTRPAIANALPDLTGYHTVLLASPIWNVRPPMIMSTFAEALDFSGKTVHPVVTYAVSGLGRSAEVYADLLPDATLADGLAIQGEVVADAGPDLDSWLSAAGLTGNPNEESKE